MSPAKHSFALGPLLLLLCAIGSPLRVAGWPEGDTSSFPRFPGRRVYPLSGDWDFAFLGEVSFSAAAAVREEDLCRKVSVPDAFDAREWLCPLDACPDASTKPCARCCDTRHGPAGDESCWRDGSVSFHRCCDPVAFGRRGMAVYRTFLPPEINLLHFRACSLRCAVLVDRHVESEHVGGYSPFWVELAPRAGHAGNPISARELLVVVDNRFEEEAPVHQQYFDWLQQGGLLRPVEAHALKQAAIYIQRLEVLPQKPSKPGSWPVQLRLQLSEAARDLGLVASFGFDSAPLHSKRVLRSGLLEFWIEEVPMARPWSVASPELHTLTLAIVGPGGFELDRTTVRFGLRLVEARQDKIFVNGEPVVLLGVNRHESSPTGGIYLSVQQLHQDVSLLKELGANFVRGAHYSQDQRFLDLCDENGILVWEETAAWQPRLDDLQDPVFVAQQLQALDETIDASINHASVIMWGFLNEGETTSVESRSAYQQLASFARAKDSSRLVSWASRHKINDKTLDLADVISFNDYPGWYDSAVSEIPDTWRRYAEWVRLAYPGKPFLAGEAGASGLAGFRRPAGSQGGQGGLEMWSEDLQASIVGVTVTAAAAAGLAGVALWQFADSRVDVAPFIADNPPGGQSNDEAFQLPEPMLNASEGALWVEQVAVGYQTTMSPFGRHMPLRPRGLNNKGLVSLSRQHRKLAYWAAQEAFSGFCFASAGLRHSDQKTLPAARLQCLGSFGGLSAAGRESLSSGCIGCVLAVHTWNVADRPQGEPGLRVHGHTLEARASHWELQSGGFLRLVGHGDGRIAALGGFLAVAAMRDELSSFIAVREGTTSLWRLEPVGGVRELPGALRPVPAPEPFLLRVAFGPRCGAYLSLGGSSGLGDQRDENSVYAMVHMDASLATAFRAWPLPGSNGHSI
eukprot:TRINITY_DN102580_c0_g1_i1.p1 TRINITY_DN102580_c0_g1~~TRINITY_DN102580_c0_g1_i1.p1  ORF type:complete len:912 (-),score=162.07 TRINITY_DN102580_c0_g1_i1:72-2807(-)